uniref:Uncharacterized protein n=1 Tax=Anguilla anguilla TaxID=7936 RepID=A0A0E9TH82_ANGAN
MSSSLPLCFRGPAPLHLCAGFILRNHKLKLKFSM